MQIVLLSGGSGKRLWPLSNESRSKQFLELLDYKNKKESMVERIYRQLCETYSDCDFTVSTSITQKHMVQTQMSNNVDIVSEPARRNTYPAIMLVSSYLYYEKKVDLEEPIIIMPIDPYVEKEYFEKFNSMYNAVKNNECNICLLGVEPTYPSSKFGYIIPDENDNVLEFKEKPNEEIAKEYIAKKGLWNCGVFCIKLKYLINILKENLECNSYEDVYNNFEKLEKLPFDIKVVEKEKKIKVIRYSGMWKDLGTWNTLTEEIKSNTIGNVILGENCTNTHIINELNIPIIGLGLKDIVVAASPDGIFVSDKQKSSYNKQYVDQLDERVKYEERQWGKYTVLDENKNMLVKNLYINKGKSLSYQRHAYRDEVWTIVTGEGFFVLDGEERKVKPNDVLYIPKHSMHSIKATKEIELVEVQLGSNFVEEDIERFEYTWKN